MAETKTCGDCIHADICKEVVGSWFSTKNIAYCKGFKDRTNYVEVVHGGWIKEDDYYCCSKCGQAISSLCVSWYKFCPNCGAKMDGERKGDDAR